jgi:quinol monooxygenase YgiN
MEIFIFAKFHARARNEANVTKTLVDVLLPSRAEPGCIMINAFRANRDPLLFFMHAHWKDEQAFERHIKLPHTIEFVRHIEPLIDHPLELSRTVRIG